MNAKLFIALLCYILLVGLVSAESDTTLAEQPTEQVKKEAEFQSRIETLRKEVQDLKEQLQNARTEQEKIEKEFRKKEAEPQSEIETLKKKVQELKNERTVVMYVVCGGIGIIIFFIFITHFFRRESLNGDGFEALIVDSVTDLLKRKMPNPPNDLKRQISDVIKHNAVSGSSLRSFARAEYNIKKVDANNVSLTVNVLYIVSSSDIVKLTSESIIRWDDLPKEIRNDFIQNRKTEQIYNLYKQ